MAAQVSEETIILVAVVIGIFLLALLCLACSLNPRELLDGSLFRCCRCCSPRRGNEERDTLGRVYDSLGEFIFEFSDEGHDRTGQLAMTPTTMEQVFPDLLGSDEPPTPQRDLENALFGTGNNDGNADLREPLL